MVPERREPAKKKVTILAEGKMLEVEEDPGDQRCTGMKARGCPGALARNTCDW